MFHDEVDLWCCSESSSFLSQTGSLNSTAFRCVPREGIIGLGVNLDKSEMLSCRSASNTVGPEQEYSGNPHAMYLNI